MGRLALIALGIGALVVMGGANVAPPRGLLAPPPSAEPAALAPAILLPEGLRIPSAGVSTTLQAVGLDARGRMGIPSNYTDAAWFKLGVAPGQRGNAVIAAHLTDKQGKPAVFWDLHELRPGDEVLVESSGHTLKFRVTGSKVYNFEDREALTEIFGPHDKARLNLITCDGLWVRSAKSYSQRLVVFTELVEGEGSE